MPQSGEKTSTQLVDEAIQKDRRNSRMWICIRVAGMLGMGFILNDLREASIDLQKETAVVADYALNCDDDQATDRCDELRTAVADTSTQDPDSQWPTRLGVILSSGAISLSYVVQLKRQGRAVQLLRDRQGVIAENFENMSQRIELLSEAQKRAES